MYAELIDAARMALIRGDRPAAATFYRDATNAARGEPGLERELASTLVQLGKLEQELGRPADAERSLAASLEIGERAYGAEHPSLSVVLNELSRLHIRQSSHARALPVLERLLRISRMKGEDHPDVATALAGLAVVHRGLGDDVAAERHYRDALRIREKVLAPNHMATVVTLEQLSATCSARGNHGEARALLERALETREAALGADHPTVSALRTRIATLDLRAAATVAPVLPVAPAAAVAAPVAAAPSRANELEFIYQPEPPVRRRAPQPQARPRTATPARAMASVAVAAPIATAPIVAAPVVAVAAPTMPARSFVPTPVADMVISLAPESEQAAVAPRHIDWTERLLSVRTALYSSAGLATVAFAIGAIVSTPTTDVSSYSADPRVGARHHVTAPATNAGKSLDASARAARTTASEAAASAVTTTATPASDAASKAPSVPTAPKRLATLSVPSIAMKNVDSLVRVSTRTSRESFADQIGTSGGIGASAVGGDASGTPPTLIGQAPMPYFPEALRSQFTEGEVVVRFRVDEHGRVDLASMKVVKTDHELFTLAVRNVLPRFRFEPARSAAPESKARAEWVDWRAEFSVKN